MRIVLIALIMLVAVGAGFAVLQMSQPQPQVNTVVEDEPKLEVVNILVARGPIASGTVITEDMIDQQPWPKHLLLSTFITSEDETFNVIQRVARADFQAQEPLTRAKLANPNDANFIAAALPEGMRALTLSVDAISGVAGFVFVGDRVDIILTHRIPNDLGKSVLNLGASGVRAGFAETLLSDIKVLAVDTRSANQKEQKEGGVKTPTNITVQLTPEQAQSLRLAEANGSVSLALRSLKDKENQVVAITKLGDLTQAKMAAGRAGGNEVFIIRGVQSSNPAASSAFSYAPPPN